jgi:hypothetical protein
MRSYLDDGLLLLGAVLVTAGAGMVYLPAGVMVAGGFLILAGVLVARSSAVSRRSVSSKQPNAKSAKKIKGQEGQVQVFGENQGQGQVGQGMDEDGLV